MKGLDRQQGNWAARVCITYFVFAGTWILVSDLLLTPYFHATEPTWQAAKGMGFVAATGILLYFILSQVSRRNRRLLDEAESYRDRFEEIAENVDGVFHLADPQDRRLLYVSPKYETIFGRSPQLLEANPEDWLNALVEEDRDRVRRERAEQGPGEPNLQVYRVCNAEGEERWILDTIRPVFDGEGRVVRHAGMAQDITEFRRTLDREQALHQQLETFFAISPDSFAILSEAGRFARWNRLCEESLGYGAEGLKDRPFLDCVHPGDRAAAEEELEKIRTSETARNFSLRMKTSEDGFFWMDWSGRAGTDGMVFLAGRDVTATRERTARLRLLEMGLKASALGTVITDREGVIEWVNPAFLKMSGYEEDEIIGQPIAIQRSDRRGRDFYEEVWEKIRAGDIWQGEVTSRRKDGSTYQEELTITPIRNPGGEIENYITFKQDITERNQLRDQFLQTQRMESLGMLAGGVAHDLNNVLAPISLSLELLRRTAPDDRNRQYLDVLEKSCGRGAAIIRQILTFARGAEGERVLLQPRHLVREIIAILKSTLPKKITVAHHLPDDLPTVRVDPTQIHQVLMNLAVNARDAMPEGGELKLSAAREHLSARKTGEGMELPPGEYLRLEVEDSGTGMDAATRDRIFEPFFTTKEKGAGTGLGLSTSLGVIKSHDGLIEVESNPGAGTRFIIYLPVSGGEEGSPEMGSEAELRGRGRSLLLVDDEPAVLEFARLALESMQFKVTAAKNGAEGVAAFARAGEFFDAVITDLDMPVMDGVGLVSYIRQNRKDIPLLVITGAVAETEQGSFKQRMSALGVTAVLEKPFGENELLRALADVLD